MCSDKRDVTWTVLNRGALSSRASSCVSVPLVVSTCSCFGLQFKPGCSLESCIKKIPVPGPCLWVRRPWGIWGWGAVAELKWKPGHAQVPLPASHSSLYWTPGRNIVLTHHFHPCWSLPAGDEPCMGRSRAVNSRSYPQGLDDSLNAPNICWRSFFVEQMIDWMNDSLELLCDSCCFSHFILREQNPHNYKGKYNKFQCICSGN